jgi:NADPH2:quinone reductase
MARRELQEWVAGGTVRITVGQSFPLHQAAEAHRLLESRETHGKLILVPAAGLPGNLLADTLD